MDALFHNYTKHLSDHLSGSNSTGEQDPALYDANLCQNKLFLEAYDGMSCAPTKPEAWGNILAPEETTQKQLMPLPTAQEQLQEPPTQAQLVQNELAREELAREEIIEMSRLLLLEIRLLSAITRSYQRANYRNYSFNYAVPDQAYGDSNWVYPNLYTASPDIGSPDIGSPDIDNQDTSTQDTNNRDTDNYYTTSQQPYLNTANKHHWYKPLGHFAHQFTNTLAHPFNGSSRQPAFSPYSPSFEQTSSSRYSPSPEQTNHKPFSSALHHIAASAAHIIAAAKHNIGRPVWAFTKFASVCQAGYEGCAATVSELLQEGGINIPGSACVSGLVNQLSALGWHKIKINNKHQFQAGDIVYGLKGSHAHIGIISETNNNQVLVCDNSSSSGTLKERSIESGGSFTPNGRFSGSLYVMRQ